MRFAAFTRPDGSKILVSKLHVELIRPPHKNEQGHAVLDMGARVQQVMETMEQAHVILESDSADV